MFAKAEVFQVFPTCIWVHEVAEHERLLGGVPQRGRGGVGSEEGGHGAESSARPQRHEELSTQHEPQRRAQLARGVRAPARGLAQLDLDATRIFYADFQHMMTNPSRYGQIGRHLRLRTQRLSKKALTMSSIDLEGIIQEPNSTTPSRLPPRREATEPKRLVAEPRDRPSDSSSSASQSLRRSG